MGERSVFRKDHKTEGDMKSINRNSQIGLLGGGQDKKSVTCCNEIVSLKMTLDTHSSDNKRVRKVNLKSKRLGAILKALFQYVDAACTGLCHSNDSSGKGYVHQLGVIKERTQEYIKHPLF